MHVMPVSMTIRDVPDETRAELAARAARAGQSLQEYVRAQLNALVATPDQAELWNRVRRRLRATGSSISTADILAAKDSDRA